MLTGRRKRPLSASFQERHRWGKEPEESGRCGDGRISPNKVGTFDGCLLHDPESQLLSLHARLCGLVTHHTLEKKSELKK